MGPGNNTGSCLGSVSQTSADVRTTFALGSVPTGGGTYAYVSGRRVSAGNEYRVGVKVGSAGQVSLVLCGWPAARGPGRAARSPSRG